MTATAQAATGRRSPAPSWPTLTGPTSSLPRPLYLENEDSTVRCIGSDTPLALKGGGCSVQRPSQRRDSPTALSAPVDGSGRMLLPVAEEAAGGADLRADGERVLHALPTAATVLRGRRRMDRCPSLPGACCRARAPAEEAAPSGVVERGGGDRLCARPRSGATRRSRPGPARSGGGGGRAASPRERACR